MPTYEYACGSCHRHVEAVQRFSDPPLTECPHCGGPLKRVFHPVGIVLKGSGFYSTDNRSGKKTPVKTKDEASSGTGTGTGTDAAKPSESAPSSPAPKPESKPAATKKEPKK